MFRFFIIIISIHFLSHQLLAKENSKKPQKLSYERSVDSEVTEITEDLLGAPLSAPALIAPLQTPLSPEPATPKYLWGLNADLLNYEKNTATKTSQLNQLSMTVHLKYELNPRLFFQTKIRISNNGPESHAGGDVQQGSLQIEKAYIEHRPGEGPLSLRVGKQLIPVGISNIDSELINELSVRPPDLESVLIPYAWGENGLLFVGEWEQQKYYLGAFNSLDGSQFDSSNSSRNFLLDGVQQGQNAKSQDVMGVFRADYHINESYFGGSILYGDTAQDSNYEKLSLTLGEVHTLLRFYSLQLRAMWAIARMTEAYKVIGPTFFDQASGYYLTLSYDPLYSENQDHQLPIFIRYSEYDLHDKVSLVGVKDPTFNRFRTTVGINYRYKQNTAYKFNYQWRKNAVSKETDLIEFSAHFAF